MNTLRPAVIALVCCMASPALSKDLCVQIDEGVFGGSVIVLKGVKLGAQQFGPVHGYRRVPEAPVPAGRSRRDCATDHASATRGAWRTIPLPGSSTSAPVSA